MKARQRMIFGNVNILGLMKEIHIRLFLRKSLICHDKGGYLLKNRLKAKPHQWDMPIW